ncbi:MAG: recombinase family protein [Lachnospiraceae bacterium]|nr:recombinase family protein [Lachnospiraceae bacterium]
MARTSRKNRQSGSEIKKTPLKVYSVGIYARLSVEGTDRKNESVEIQTELCRRYVSEHNDMELFDCYSDLGRTGTNFEREGFERLMQDVRLRKVDCIVVKDFSRFGRNHLEMGNYLGKIFPFLGVRFIAVCDHYDSMDGDPETMAVQLKNLVNELYAKDISAKVRSSREKQWERGSFCGNYPAYGYRAVIKGNIRKLEVEEEAAEIVREIYRRFLDGCTVAAINRWLYSEKIHRPSDYRNYGHVRQQEGEELHGWDTSSINVMLNNCAYIGYLICQNKDGKRVKGRKSFDVINGNCKVIKDNHEPIISKEDFEACARKFESRSMKNSSGSIRKLPLEEDIYKGLLVCGECGAKFTRVCGLNGHKNSNVRNYQYACVNRGKIDSRKCENDRISLIVLNRVVLAAFEREFSLSTMRQKDLTEISRQRAEEEKKNVRAELRRTETRMEDMKRIGSEDYLKFRIDGMTQEEFEEKNEKRKAETDILEGSLKTLARRLKEIDGETERRNRYLRMLMKGKESTPLTSEVLHALIEEIQIFPGKRVQIVFKFTGKELWMLERTE